MQSGKTGWLQELIDAEVSRHAPPPAAPQGQRRAAARRHLRTVLRESGLLYGTPKGAAPVPEGQGLAPEEVLFLAVLRTLVRLALDIAALYDAPKGSRSAQALVLIAVQAGELSLADSLDAGMRRGEAPSAKVRAKVEAAIERRSVSLSGNPSYGLMLHNGALFADAHLFGRQAIDYFTRGKLRRKSAERRSYASAQQKAVLVEVLTALACAERPPSFPARRAILRQIDDLALPDDLASTLRSRVKLDFERRPSLKRIVASVRSPEMRRFLLQQTLLASLVDGRRSPGEVAFLKELAATLKFPPAQVQQVELEMAEFYARNRQVVDVFTVSAGAEVMGEELVATMQRTMERHFNSLMQEVRETGELSLLLAKAARGKRLTTDERRRMRAQLIDVAKAIPALAIFTAPGGLLLLIALAKVLPFDLLPSAFKPPEDEG